MSEENNRKILLEGGTSEIKIKGSTFIGRAGICETQEEAVDFINAVKKECYNATHNCSAYICENGRIMHQSDDGEPQGTAGLPILDVLKGSGIENIVMVVTRYFGGTLLGTGGLVRAYSSSAGETLNFCKVAEICHGRYMEFTIGYDEIGYIKYLINERGIHLLEEIYEAEVTLKTVVPLKDADAMVEDIRDHTKGSARFAVDKEVEYLVTGSEVIIR